MCANSVNCGLKVGKLVFANAGRTYILCVNDELQGWVLHHISPITPWATGIGTIEADWAMASEPEEGEDYDHQS